MGLDMYLYEEEYVSPYANKERHEELCKALGRNDVSTITYKVGQWRKANAIHQWFVDNVQNGIDECQKAYVPEEKLEELYKLCKKVLQVAKTKPIDMSVSTITPNGIENQAQKGRDILNKHMVADLLPTTEGFFFGSTDYDEWYLQDIELTIEILEKIRNEDGTWGSGLYADFYYQSSW